MNDKLKQLRPQRGNYYISMDPMRLAENMYADRLFIFYRSSLNVGRVKNELQSLPDWETIPAVRANKVYYLHEYWNGEDAITSEATLEHFPDLWE